MLVSEFCEMHDACEDGFEWAQSNNAWDISVSDLWLRDDLPDEYRIWVATREGVLPDRELRLFACWCVRQIWHLLSDDRSKKAVEVAELFANGDASEDELSDAMDAALDARDALDARAAASDNDWYAAMAAWTVGWLFAVSARSASRASMANRYDSRADAEKSQATELRRRFPTIDNLIKQ